MRLRSLALVVLAGCSTTTTAAVVHPSTTTTVATTTTAAAAAPTTVTATTEPQTTTTTMALPMPSRVVAVGDSGLYDASPALEAAFRANGIRFSSTAFPYEGLTQPAFVHDIWASALDDMQPDLVIVGVGAWDEKYVAQNGWAAYIGESRDAVAFLTSGGARILWLSELPGVAPLDGDTAQSKTQNLVYATLPTQFPGVVDYLDIAGAFTDGNGGAPREIDGRLLRKPDGWHLCPDGAAALAHAVLTRLGLDSTSWEQGRWRRDARYAVCER